MDHSTQIRGILDDCLRRRLAGEHPPDDAILAPHLGLLPELPAGLRKAETNAQPSGLRYRRVCVGLWSIALEFASISY